MKYLPAFALLSILLISCNKESDPPIHIGNWKLDRIFGGIAGANCDYSSYNVVYTFTENEVRQNMPLPPMANVCSGYAITDTIANYSIIHKNNKQYLSVNGHERGLMIIENGRMLINQNEISDAELADAPLVELIKI